MLPSFQESWKCTGAFLKAVFHNPIVREPHSHLTTGFPWLVALWGRTCVESVAIRCPEQASARCLTPRREPVPNVPHGFGFLHRLRPFCLSCACLKYVQRHGEVFGANPFEVLGSDSRLGWPGWAAESLPLCDHEDGPGLEIETDLGRGSGGGFKGSQKENPSVPFFGGQLSWWMGLAGLTPEMAVGQNQWDPILGEVNSPPILEPVLVVGLGCSLGV